MKLAVDMVSFDQALADKTPGQVKIQRSDYLPTGSLPIIDQGQKPIAGYTNDSGAAYQGPLPAIVFGDHTLAFKYVDFDFALGADGVRVLAANEPFVAKYIYYYFLSAPIQSRGYSRHFKFLREVKFPHTANSEQRRVVELLDQANELRRKRVEADKLSVCILPSIFQKMFGDPATNPKGWPAKPLGRAVQMLSGGTPSKANQEFWNGNIPWVSPKDMKSLILTDTEDHITQEAIAGSATTLIQSGSAMIVVRSGILAHSVPVAMADKPMSINQDIKALVPNLSEIEPLYLLGWLLASKGTLLGCVKRGATVHSIDSGKFQTLQFMLPDREKYQVPFARQFKIVLDMWAKQELSKRNIENIFNVMLHRAFTGELTAKWREAHLKELLVEMEHQAKLLRTAAETN
jgi:type I restriction enzyme S subunit